MNTNTAVILSALVAVSLFSAFAFVAPAVTASSLQNHVKNAHTFSTSETTSAILQTNDVIKAEGAYGFGILTEKGLDGVMVATTHGGVLDSEVQVDANDPAWHTHYVKLGQGVSGLCGENPEVVDITFQAPGYLATKNKMMVLKNLPATFNGTSSLSGNGLTVEPGTTVGNVVAFSLEPKFDGDALKAVCVTEITPAHHLTMAEKVR